jgi:2-oxoglutarate dehydrogenase E1 component
MEPADLNLVALLGANLQYLDEIYERFKADPAAVDPGFRALLSGTDGVGLPSPPGRSPAATQPARPTNGQPPLGELLTSTAAATAAAISTSEEALVQELTAARVNSLIEAYRRYGHLAVQLDPLDIERPSGHPELRLEAHGFSSADLDRLVPAGSLYGTAADAQMTLGELVLRLTQIYAGAIGLESSHIDDPERRHFLLEFIESRPNRYTQSRAEQLIILDRLMDAEVIEQFIHTKYVSAKRFSLEGGKALIPLLDYVLENAGRQGVQEMTHRGRLNVLANLMHKSPRLIFAEFEDLDPESVMGSGDVKYHMGYSTDHVTRGGHKLHLSLAFNPSHLEAVDPVVVGRVRAKQQRLKDRDCSKVCGVLVHGDAAFAGQGLVAETLNLSGLEGYLTGGTIHIIVNNQIGFTTNPRDSRSTRYCTDVAKMLQVPVLHVRGTQLEEVVYAVELAMEFRQRFHTDVVIDMVCFRRYGHNESDEPSFTQPVMYKKIEKQVSVTGIYARSLRERGLITQPELDAMLAQKHAQLETELTAARSSASRPIVETMTGLWRGYRGGFDRQVPDVDTAVPAELLQEIARCITHVPKDFTPHPKIERLLTQRAAMARGQTALDWGMGEALAFGSLLAEKVLVRVSGQDSRRGTFSQRHAVLFDHNTGQPYTPLAHLRDDPSEQGHFSIFDSMLSEAAVLGFEYGFSLDYPDGLVCWEAQFGDFVNGAQVILDQFVSSAEDKWRRLSGLVLLLPHGYEGQGPEHSSARYERFLQLGAEDNIQVVYPTTPAQYFHLLRRQVHRPWRKPLVVMTPKSLLRVPLSHISELSTGRFHCVIGDKQVQPDQVTRVMLCTGKVYFDLVEQRKKRGDTRTAIIRVEQLYPLRTDELQQAVGAFSKVRELIWVQEEPANMGALQFIMPLLQHEFASTMTLRSASRVESASPATGSHKAHVLEQHKLMSDAFAERKGGDKH